MNNEPRYARTPGIYSNLVQQNQVQMDSYLVLLIMDYIDNTELYNEIDNNIKFQLENALTHLEIVIDDINDGMYENSPIDEEEIEEWD